MKQVMTVAWKLAKKGAKKFGGSPVEYLSESLKIAWQLTGVKKQSKKAKLTISKGSHNHKSWVAEIVGTNAVYKYNRKFVDSVNHNWTEKHYELEKGVYEVCDAGERYFIEVTAGKIRKIEESKVMEAIA